jgi:hypothetical protein
LLSAADLKAARDHDAGINANLGRNWLIVKDWSETSRYEQKIEPEARALSSAITDSAGGVLPWIKLHW